MAEPRIIEEFELHSVSLVSHPPHVACSIRIISERGPAQMANMLETNEYTRKPIKGLAVEVTAENMKDVSDWVDGEILEDKIGPYIKVKVLRPQYERQTRAYVGDFVVLVKTSFKVYNPAAFKKSFTKSSGGSTMVDTTKKVRGPVKNEGEIVRVIEGDVVVPKRIPAAKKSAKKSA